MASRDRDRRIAVCDASPLIFLSKVDALALLRQVLGGRIVVLRCVVDEVLGERAGPVESERLRRWLGEVEVIDFEGEEFAARALSWSDRSSLAWAVRNRVDWLVADERLLRRFAKDQGIGVIGFCGLLVKGVERGFLPAGEARRKIDAAVDEHGLRISIALYRRILETLGRLSG